MRQTTTGYSEFRRLWLWKISNLAIRCLAGFVSAHHLLIQLSLEKPVAGLPDRLP
jgi:hypothetical protein